MPVTYGKFEMPQKIKIDKEKSGENFVRFIAEPFERGFGHTIGNALRRIMLTSLEAPAIVSIRLEGVSHEFTPIEGVIEDMTHIILNMKNVLLRRLPMSEEKGSRDTKVVSKELEISQDLIDQAGGNYSVTAQDILGPCEFEPINPKMVVFTVTKPMKKRVDLKISIGRGYVPSERHVIVNKHFDEIVIDSIFSPVTQVNYFIENTRVGQDTDFDRLIIDVATDGRITPQEAIGFATQILTDHLHIFDSIKQYDITFDKEEGQSDEKRGELMNKLSLKIDEIELSVRSTNCLSGASIETIGELVIMPEHELLKFRNFGKKSLTEIKQKLDEMGLHLGMDLTAFGITKENIKEKIKTYLEEQEGKKES